MVMPLALESFDEGAVEEIANDEFGKGYEEGMQAGRAAAAAEIEALNAQFVQAISDIDFTYAEARAQILQSLTPLFETVISQVVPACISSGFANQIVAHLQRAADDDSAQPIRVHVHPEHQAAVSALVSDLSSPVEVRNDPTIGPNAAWIEKAHGTTFLDFDGLMKTINEALSLLSTSEPRMKSNG